LQKKEEGKNGGKGKKRKEKGQIVGICFNDSEDTFAVLHLDEIL
jgi:hypothetical protein